MTNLSYDSNSLQTANILTNSIDHFSLPTKTLNLYALAQANRSAIPYISYPSKTITVTGVIVDTTIAGLDARLDTFRSYFVGQDKNLDIDYNGSTRRYIATVNTLTIDRPGGLLYANFSIEFICVIPFGTDTSQTTILNPTGRTLAAYTDSYTFAGTAPYQKPIFTITFTAISGGTTKTVTVGNASNGQSISVTRTWTAGDVLVVDTTLKTVTVNGVAVDFTGAFPEFPPGAQSITYNDNFTTSRTFNYNVVYAKTYL